MESYNSHKIIFHCCRSVQGFLFSGPNRFLKSNGDAIFSGDYVTWSRKATYENLFSRLDYFYMRKTTEINTKMNKLITFGLSVLNYLRIEHIYTPDI